MSRFGASRTVVIRASRDTLGLVFMASAMTFAMAYAVHSKREKATPPAEARTQAPLQAWAGHLAELVPPSATVRSEPMSSAALVVPKSQLSLPTIDAKLPVKRPCLEVACAAKTPTAVAAAAKRGNAATERAPEETKRTLLGMLNPLNHLPDMAAVGKPFSYAGNTVAGWFKGL